MVELPSANNLAAQGSGDLDIANFPPLRAATQVDFAGAGSSAGKEWNLLDQSLPFYPLLSAMKVADKLWGREGSITIMFLSPSVYVLNFPSKRVRDWVLESGPWHIRQRVIILRRWVPGLATEALDLNSAPIWIKLWHVPLELFSQKGLDCLASALGKPLYTDRPTMLKQNLEFAKICVNIDAKFVLPKFIPVELSKGNCIDVGVEIVWPPPKCEHCCIFGHLGENCSWKVNIIPEELGSGGDLLVNVETVAVADVIDSAAAGFEPVETVGRTVDIVVGVPDNLVPVASGADVGVNVGGDIAIYDGHRCVPICDVVGTAEIVQSNMDQIEAIGSQSHGLFSGIEVEDLSNDDQHILCYLKNRDMRDFNIVRDPQESSNFDGSQVITAPVQEFIDCHEADSIAWEKCVANDLFDMVKAEEIFLRQKSRV
ncbi:hypothetical protein V6N13_101080 [Hibiscus sabdariffa]